MSLKLNYYSSAFRICVDEVRDHYISGRIVSQRLMEPVPFSDINQLISQLDDAMDSQQYPKAFQQIRSFNAGNIQDSSNNLPLAMCNEEMISCEDISALCGKTATFQLHITLRQNASWQGFINWMDMSGQQDFNSTLEFLNALDSKLPLWEEESQLADSE